MSKPPFRFGVAVYDDASVDEWRGIARRAEGLGYSTLLIGDHVADYLPVSGSSPLLALAAAAEATNTLRVGTAMLANDFRHPAILAKDTATLDLLSGGRFELGLGAGWHRPDYDQLGLQYDRPSIRVKRLEEALTIIKACWAGDQFDFVGDHYSISGYAGTPRPIQTPRPPILVGGGSERVLRLAGREADIVGVHVSTATITTGTTTADTSDDQTRRKLEWIREGAGHRFNEIELQMMCFAQVTANREAAASAFAVGNNGTADELLTSAGVLIGTVEELCDVLERRRDAWGVSYVTVQAGAVDEFAPIVARLAGK
jgi:probable F420-dependent oxidoreductase